MDELRKEQFINSCRLIVGNERGRNGIGTLSEKTLHAVLKHYFEPDENRHEIKIGPYLADIYNDSGIIEIQTRSFNALRSKLNYFLEISKVTVVYPIPCSKWLFWLDPDTGEAVKKRKSPKRGNIFEAFFELYKIKPLLTHPNLKLCLILVDLTEYRNLNGWSADKKRGSSRLERIPENISDEIYIESLSDYIKLIPSALPDKFSSKDYRKASGLSLHNAQSAINVLKYVGAVTQTGKQGNLCLYSVTNLSFERGSV